MIRVNPILGESVTEVFSYQIVTPISGTKYFEATATAVVPNLGELWYNDDPLRYVKEPTPPPDKSSFTKIKKSGVVKFTDHKAGWMKSEDFTVSIDRSSYAPMRWANYWFHSRGKWYKDWYLYQLIEGQKVVRADYTIKADLTVLKQIYGSIPHRGIDLDSELTSKINSCMASVVSELNSSYDLLTELAEAGSTLDLLLGYLNKIRHPIQTFLKTKKRLEKSKLPEKDIHDAIASAWMQVRYGIMPIYYSIMDILKTIQERHNAYRTARSRQTIEGFPLEFEDNEMCFADEMQGTIVVRATGKLRASLDAQERLFDLVKINPFATAWELIPLSFVVDWFINVGDVIDAYTGSLLNFSQEKHYVFSVKKQYTRSTYLIDYLDERGSAPPIPPKFEVLDGISYQATNGLPLLEWGGIRRGHYLLRNETHYSYERKIFTPTDVKLDFSPFMNWKRYIDAYVLSLGHTRNLLKKLKS